MKKALIFLAIAVLLFVASVVRAEYFAAKDARKFHHADCQWVKKIRQENLLSFKTPDDARQAGYEPCKTCNPDSPSAVERSVKARPAASMR
ncbi:MAG: hypothetical protein OHK006_08170 [Thermodesulfovibrionales bacterium]